jgi:hypothetical protein
MKRTVTLYDFLRRKGRLTMLSCLTVMHVIVGLASGLTKPGEVGDFFALVSMKSPNFCQKAKF